MSSEKTVDLTIDSAASDNYIRPNDAHVLGNLHPHNGIPVTLPDAETISTSHQGDLPLNPAFSAPAKQSTVLPKLKSASLLSVGKLCDDKKMVIFDENEVKAIESTPKLVNLINEQKILLRGQRNRVDNLWHTQIDVPTTKEKIQSNNYKMPTLKAALYTHQHPSSKQDSFNLLRNFSSQQSNAKSQHSKYDCETMSMRRFQHVLRQQQQKRYKAFEICISIYLSSEIKCGYTQR